MRTGIQIWFFIGVMLFIYGVLILGYGLSELVTGIVAPVELSYLHAPIWWGGTLFILGLAYIIKFRPRRAGK